MSDFEFLIKRAKELGAYDAKIIDTCDIVTGEWVRLKCQYGCENYNNYLTCPPYSPTPSQMRKILDEYSTALLICDLVGHRNPHISYVLEKEIGLWDYYKAYGMANGRCILCKKKCHIEGCMHPEQARPSIAASGIDVMSTIHNCGFNLQVNVNGVDKICFYSILLIE